MADNDQYDNDEYQFADVEEGSPAAESEVESSAMESKTNSYGLSGASNDMRRNVIIAVVALVLIIGLYKIIGSFFLGKKSIEKINAPAISVASPPVPAPTPPVTVVQPAPEVATPSSADTGDVSRKLSDLESSQQSIRSDVSAVNGQLTGIGTSMNTMAAKMTELSNIIASLSAKVDEQSHEIEQLTIKREAKRSHYYKLPKAAPRLRYYLQAVIPGRAWLIATNGSTLTVREGTVIAGYGMVKLIDPNQGRVLTSSGQVIKFSQNDS